MTAARDFLVEIGTEELPPKALRSLMEAFTANVGAALGENRLEHGAVRGFASPRRLAVIVEALAPGQADRSVTQKGPPVSVAFDDAGKMTAAGLAFARKCGVEPSALGRTASDKGEWLCCDIVERGLPVTELMPALVESALAALPIPRRMRWGDGDAEFVRPVHWIVLLHGDRVIDATILGIPAGNRSRGHRFLGGASVEIDSPAGYLAALEDQGRVIADFERRRALVEEGVQAAAADAGGRVVDGPALYDEVTALVEWPVPLTGSFDADFLKLPREVVVSTLTGHQRYFPVAGADGELLPKFVTVANIESSRPDLVRDGNERVIRPRLADAAFFWDSDRRSGLASRQDALREVVYQRGLGSLFDKSARLASLASRIAEDLGAETEPALRAAALCKCDLLTGMVGEFPDLQGTMGRYYALADGEPEEVAEAIGEHYRPRFAGDELPASPSGQVLAIADKIDTLAGVFALGKRPSGNRDPFGLRRSALGVIRLLVECGLDLDVQQLIGAAVDLQPVAGMDKADVTASVSAFVSERLRHYFLERDPALSAETFEAVMARQPSSLVDFDSRLAAVQAFVGHEAAPSLAAANKRIGNILRQAGTEQGESIRKGLLVDAAELELFAALQAARDDVQPLLAARRYTEVLARLAGLRAAVDRFFDDVMVMAEDKATRNNRLALLMELRSLFLDVADISRLAIG